MISSSASDEHLASPVSPGDGAARPFLRLDGVGIRFPSGARHTTLKTALLRALGRGRSTGRESERWALRDVNLDLEPGTRLGVIGPNGAGKTTLLQLMARIFPPTTGRVLHAGRLVPVLQLGVGFNPELSGRENALFAAAVMGLPVRDMEQRLDGIFSFCELEEASEMPLKHYSAGMAARLAFTVATEAEPDILLLDEVFAVGDQRWTERAIERIESLIDRVSVLVLVSHALPLIERLCNRAVWLERGRAVADSQKVGDVLAAYRAP